MTLKLTHIVHLEGELILRTGLHIGAGKSDIAIGGLDLPVQKDKSTERPLIPGSSLKGKLRTLLEWKAGAHGRDNGPYLGKQNDEPGNNGDAILRIFGALPESKQDWPHGPGRLKVADLHVLPNSEWEAEDYCEEKPETAMNRASGTVQSGTLRAIERVVAGTRFKMDLSFRIFENGVHTLASEQSLLRQVMEGLELVTLDGLGGSTSRGYGRIGFQELKLNARKLDAQGIIDEDWSCLEPFATILGRLNQSAE